MADSVRRYGTLAAYETPDSPERVAVVRGFETTRKFAGQYDVLLALQPLLGDASATDGDVTDSKLSHEAGDSGVLTVKYLKQATEYGFVKLPFQQNPRVEITFNQVEKSIESHPTKGLLAGDGITPDFTKLSQLEAWRQAPPTRKQAFQIPKTTVKDPTLDDDSDWEALSDSVQKIAAKNLAGMENYILFVPLIRQVGTYLTKPDISAGGVIETPPVSAPGFTHYLRLGDSLTQREDGSWELVSVWQGADRIDTDYYSAAT